MPETSGPGHATVALVVDDELLVRLGTSGILEDEGYEVLEAAGAAEALTMLEARSDVELLVADVKMPGDMDGLGLAWLVSRSAPGVAIVLLSGQPHPSKDEMPAHAVFVAKPAVRSALIRTARSAVEAAASRR